jgi:hypothetical protein
LTVNSESGSLVESDVSFCPVLMMQKPTHDIFVNRQ